MVILTEECRRKEWSGLISTEPKRTVRQGSVGLKGKKKRESIESEEKDLMVKTPISKHALCSRDLRLHTQFAQSVVYQAGCFGSSWCIHDIEVIRNLTWG